ncbi:uncharacterized protein LOC126745932 [Anthonomus grandis grandis]|uniref:uncharacterized protein LOC126745932 n=1 Tax=Anthonomus grandis grandis TaxID=2921223 RepID=UPI002165B887|nr:uncharacterized protein LOC126745932 [Anthonomus grandis grandis]
MGDKKKPTPAPVDIYDDEFYTNLKIAKGFINQLGTRGDKQICKKWIAKLVKLKSDDPVVKRNRNSFFRYLLSVMEKAIKDSAYKVEGGKNVNDENHFMCKWSNDKRTYIAAKPLPGLGTLVYMAVAKDPSLGWDHP